MKSKSGNSLEVTQWRNREARRTHEIIAELRRQGPRQLIFLGDVNDSIGLDEFEKMEGSGGDTVRNLAGDDLVIITQRLQEAGDITYGGYNRPRYRSFIDHAVVTPELKDRVRQVYVFTEGLARVASDHYPVVVKIEERPEK